jgi:hypothetical protein
MLEELPPMAAGEWLCTGFEDPIYIRLEEGDEMPWSGTACGPSLPLGDPSEYTNCDDLDFSHFNVTSTQAYWVFELPYEGLGMEPILFEFGVSYAADTDTLEGFLWADTTLEYQAETCTRQAG